MLIAVLAAFLFAGKGKEADEPVQQAASAVQASPVANAPIVLPPANNSGGAQPAPQQPDQPQQPQQSIGGSDANRIAAQVAEMNRQLPRLLGDGVRLEKVLYVEASNTMIMQFTLTKLRQRDISAAQLEQIKSALGPEMARTSCQDPNVAPWLTSGGTLLVSFYDRNNRHLIDASLSGADYQQ